MHGDIRQLDSMIKKAYYFSFRVNGRPVRFLLTVATLLAGLSIRPVAAQDLSVVGQWSTPQAWPVTA